MKKFLTSISLLAFGLFVLASFVNPDHPAVAAGSSIKYSKKVDAIIQNKCFGCHNMEGKNEKAKMKLMWDKLPEASAEEQSAKLKDILTTLEKGSMPPARFLQSNADKKLTEAETATLTKWAQKTAKKVGK